MWEAPESKQELKGFTSAHQPPASCFLMTERREEGVETPLSLCRTAHRGATSALQG